MTSASTAQAALITVDSVGDTFTVNFNGNVEGTPIAGLSASALIEVTSLTATTIGLNVQLTNTTSAPLSSRVSVFAFDTTPDVTDAGVTGDFNVANPDGGNVPNGVGQIEACFKDGGPANNCAGGAGGGVLPGDTATFDLLLTFVGPIAQFDFDRFAVRYQSIVGVTQGTSGTGLGTPEDPLPLPAPEPTSMVLLGTGLLGIVSAARRRARK